MRQQFVFYSIWKGLAGGLEVDLEGNVRKPSVLLHSERLARGLEEERLGGNLCENICFYSISKG